MKFCDKDPLPGKWESSSVPTQVLLSIQIDQIQTRETGGVFDIIQLQGIRSGFHEHRKGIISTIQSSLRNCNVMVQVVKGSGYDEIAKELVGQIRNWIYQNRIVHRELSSQKDPACWIFPNSPNTLCHVRKSRKHNQPQNPS